MITAAFVTVCLSALAQIALTTYVIVNRKMNVKLAFALPVFVALSAIELTALAGFSENVELVKLWDFEVQDFERQVSAIKDEAGQQIDSHALRQLEAAQAAVDDVAKAGAALEKQTAQQKSLLHGAERARTDLEGQLQTIRQHSSSGSAEFAALEKDSRAVAGDLERQTSLVRALGENIETVRGIAEASRGEFETLRASDAWAAEQIETLEQSLAQTRIDLAKQIKRLPTVVAASKISSTQGDESAASGAESPAVPSLEQIEALNQSTRELGLLMTKMGILQVATQTPNGQSAREAVERELMRDSVTLLSWVYPEAGDRLAWIEELNESLGVDLVKMHRE